MSAHESTSSTTTSTIDGTGNSQRASEVSVGVKKEQNKDKYKTLLCQNFMKQGFCSVGAKCLFAHGDHELRTPENGLGIKAKAIENYKKALCRDWQQHGHCIRGVNCTFAHGEHELNMKPPQQYQNYYAHLQAASIRASGALTPINPAPGIAPPGAEHFLLDASDLEDGDIIPPAYCREISETLSDMYSQHSNLKDQLKDDPFLSNPLLAASFGYHASPTASSVADHAAYAHAASVGLASAGASLASYPHSPATYPSSAPSPYGANGEFTAPPHAKRAKVGHQAQGAVNPSLSGSSLDTQAPATDRTVRGQDVFAQLSQLVEWKTQGIINENEFARMKAALNI
jgi:hypothetical protein